MKNLIYLIVLLFIATSCGEQDSENIVQIKESETMTLDSLRKMNIDIELWSESKESFERLHNAKLESVSSRNETFKSDLTSEFSWEGYKRYMKWEVTKMDIWTSKSTNKFVVIGDYFQDGNKLKFWGQVYKYPTE